ncbi:MAG: hypothetical protein QNJ15_09575 [Erythrobacter sp.]|nr:hypothetical protein [Erythrobacter sp.]
MAFADALVEESDQTMIIIDQFAMPGGHWNIADPFVQLHQPASFYGVSSKDLSSGRIANKIDLKRLQDWIGHESIQLTLDTFGHLLADQERDAESAALASRDLFA